MKKHFRKSVRVDKYQEITPGIFDRWQGNKDLCHWRSIYEPNSLPDESIDQSTVANSNTVDKEGGTPVSVNPDMWLTSLYGPCVTYPGTPHRPHDWRFSSLAVHAHSNEVPMDREAPIRRIYIVEVTRI